MSCATPVVTDAATLEEVIDVFQEHVPIEMEGECLGIIGLDSVSKEKHWEEDVTALLHIVGNIFANAIKKKLAEEMWRTR